MSQSLEDDPLYREIDAAIDRATLAARVAGRTAESKEVWFKDQDDAKMREEQLRTLIRELMAERDCLIIDYQNEHKRAEAAAEGYRKDAERLCKAATALLHEITNIEVLGEWSAQDINLKAQKQVRSKVDSVVAELRDAIASLT